MPSHHMIKSLILIKGHFSKLKQIIYGRNKSCIELLGKDGLAFLQGLITNDINVLNKTSALASFILNQQGRIVFDILIYKCNNEKLLINCDDSQASELKMFLSRYKMRKKLEIVINQAYRTYTILPLDFSYNNLQTYNGPLGFVSFIDPRSKLFGINYITSKNTENDILQEFNESLGNKNLYSTDNNDKNYVHIESKNGRIITPNAKHIENSPKLNFCDVSFKHESDFRAYLYKLGLSDGCRDHIVGQSLPIESNGDQLNKISFTKGCYIGQELTSRTQNIGVTRKRLMPIHFLSEDNSINTTKEYPNITPNSIIYGTPKNINTNSNGTSNAQRIKCGVVRCWPNSNPYGLGLLRIFESLNCDLIVEDLETKQCYPIATHIPDWWTINIP